MACLQCSCTCRVLIIVPHLENYGPLPLYPLPIHIRRSSCVSRSLLFWHSHRIYWEPIVQAMCLLWNYILVRCSCDNSKKLSIKNCYSLDMSPITLLYLLYLITWLSVLHFRGSVELNSLLAAKNVPAFDYC